MKYFLSALLVMSFLFCGFGGPAPETPTNSGSATPNSFLIDDFERGSLTNPDWWKFDSVVLTVVDNSSYQTGEENVLKEIGRYSLNMKGKCTNWYVGGCGIYIAKPKTDYSRYGAFVIDVWGNGPGSGTIQIELYDDDNGNWQVEQDPKKGFANIYDDKFVYNQMVDWRGWKRVSIPISDFVDENPGVGDDIWNPDQNGGSGGLIQMQMIFIGPKKSGNVRVNIDNVSLVVK